MTDFEAIEGEIKTGKYRTLAYGNVEGGAYAKCNIFTSDMAEKHWGVKLPRKKHQTHYNQYSKDQDWPENPMSAAELPKYYEKRADLMGSGVQKVTAKEGREIVNNDGLVLMVGLGHATIMAPNEKNWPLVYRIHDPWDRVKVGLKDASKYQFYHISPDDYNKFNAILEQIGLSERDVHAKFGENVSTEWSSDYNSKYELLHQKLRKSRPQEY